MMSEKFSLQKTTRPKRAKRRPDEGNLHLCPANLGSLFAKRPLVLGEEEADYDGWLSRITAAIKPVDIFESMWVKDITDLTWEAQRLRRLKTEMLVQAGQGVVEDLLRAASGAGLINNTHYSISGLATGYRLGSVGSVMQVNWVLRRLGLDADAIMARALSNRLDAVERIERMLAGIEARRNRVLGEIERRRESYIRQSRRIADDIDTDREPGAV